MPAPKYPPPARGYVRITASALDQYLECGLSYAKDRRDKRRSFSVEQAIGSAIAEVARNDNERKIDGSSPVTSKEAEQLAAIAFEAEVRDYSDRASTEIADLDLEEALRKAVSGSIAYVEHVSPNVEPTLAEKSLVAHIPSLGVEIAGTPDFYTTGDGIGDLKIGANKKTWSADKVRRHRQLTIYGLLHKAATGRFPAAVWIDHLWFTSRFGWCYERFNDARTMRDYISLLETIRRAKVGLERGVFLPASGLSWKCSPDFCRHFASCEAVGYSTQEVDKILADMIAPGS